MSYAVEKAIKLSRKPGTWEELAEASECPKPLAELILSGDIVAIRGRSLYCGGLPVLTEHAAPHMAHALGGAPVGPVRVRIVVEKGGE